MKKLLIPLLLSLSTLSYAQYPSDFSIDRLQKEYIASKQCNQTCGIFTGLKLKNVDLSSKLVVFEIPVSASQLTTVMLPFNVNNFNWVNFSMDGKNTQSVMANGERIIVAVPKGNHIIEVTAKLKPDQLRVSLEEDPKYFENNTSIKADVTQTGGSFYFEIENQKNIKTENHTQEKEMEISKDIFEKPLYNIQREIFLSDKWKVKTTILNLTPAGNNKVTNIIVPLLDGEKPLDSDLQIENGKVSLSLSGNQVSWESSLTPKDKMVLKNTDFKNLETWIVYNENSWLYNHEGMSPVSTSSNAKYKNINTWIMWPEEKVNLSFSLPKIADGQTTNVTDFHINTNWNSEPLEYTANFSINTSVGGRYLINFEDKSTELISATIETDQSKSKQIESKIKNGVLALDLFAGKNDVSLKFKSGKAEFFQKFPIIKFETPITNANFEIASNKRWVMFAGGGDIRPAILIWGIVLAFSLFAYFLNKFTKTPLGLISWLLLLLGLSQTSWMASFLIVGWILAFSFKDKYVKNLEENGQLTANKFNTFQTVLGALSIIGLITLISVVATGLMSNPEVFTVGYGTHKSALYWYMQSWDGVENNPWILSLPMSVYRVLILAWGIWLAFSLMSWIKWMWQTYSTNGYWKKHEEINPIFEEEQSEQSEQSENSNDKEE